MVFGASELVTGRVEISSLEYRNCTVRTKNWLSMDEWKLVLWGMEIVHWNSRNQFFGASELDTGIVGISSLERWIEIHVTFSLRWTYLVVASPRWLVTARVFCLTIYYTGGQLMVWDCFSWCGVVLLVVHSILTFRALPSLCSCCHSVSYLGQLTISCCFC